MGLQRDRQRHLRHRDADRGEELPELARPVGGRHRGNASWPALTVLTQNGDSGAKVKAVQSQLNESGYGLTVDGAFGPATDSAVRSFQSSKGLGVDGVVGDNTWNKMVW